jgi:hypothetical protein
LVAFNVNAFLGSYCGRNIAMQQRAMQQQFSTGNAAAMQQQCSSNNCSRKVAAAGGAAAALAAPQKNTQPLQLVCRSIAFIGSPF